SARMTMSRPFSFGYPCPRLQKALLARLRVGPAGATRGSFNQGRNIFALITDGSCHLRCALSYQLARKAPGRRTNIEWLIVARASQSAHYVVSQDILRFGPQIVRRGHILSDDITQHDKRQDVVVRDADIAIDDVASSATVANEKWTRVGVRNRDI